MNINIIILYIYCIGLKRKKNNIFECEEFKEIKEKQNISYRFLRQKEIKN